MRFVRPAPLVRLLLITAALPVLVAPFTAYAQTTSSLQAQIDAQNLQVAQLNAEIAKYEAEIQQANADKATLQSAINSLNLQRQKVETQISQTQAEINSTQLQIRQLGSSISDTEDQITADQAAIAEDMRSIQAADTQPLIAELLSTDTLSQAWTDVDAARQVQVAIRAQIGTLAAHESQLKASQTASQQKKDQLTAQKQTLSSQQTSLAQTKNQKTQLLAETSANEQQYQKLLAQAKAELASFSTFAENAGGSGILPHNAPCDSWGCYYNQRDAAWGNLPLNGTQYLLKSDGCLISSMAMVLTHYGYRDVTPVTINANPANFAAYYPAYLLMTIYVDGMTVARKSSYIDATLATGNPVIVGLRAYGGTHFVVLVSGARGKYVMRDPYVPNGNGVSFTSHYSVGQIFGVSKVVISS